MRSRAKFTSRTVQKAFSEVLLRPNPQAPTRFLARLTGKRKDGFGRSGYSSQDRPGRDAKGMLGRYRFFCGVFFACAKGANPVAPPRGLGILPPL